MSIATAPAQLPTQPPSSLPIRPPSAPFITVDCHPCGRAGVWWAGAEFVLHAEVDGTTWGCELPPRDADHLTARQRASLEVAARRARAQRRVGAGA